MGQNQTPIAGGKFTCAISAVTLSFLPVRQIAVPFERRSEMAWKTPKIVEVPVGMEINMYACAARK